MASGSKETPSDARVGPRELLARAQQALGVTGQELADLMDCSLRTMRRWTAGHSVGGFMGVGRLIPHVHAKDPALAERMHAYLTALHARQGWAPPAPLPVPAPPQPEPLPDVPMRVESVLYAAAHAIDASPRTVKTALRAALRRMRELGLSIDDVDRVIARPAKAPRA